VERESTASGAKLRTLIRVRSIVVYFALTPPVVALAACDLLPRPPAPTAADYCNVKVIPTDPDDVLLEVWAADARQIPCPSHLRAPPRWLRSTPKDWSVSRCPGSC